MNPLQAVWMVGNRRGIGTCTSSTVRPLKNEPLIQEELHHPCNPQWGILKRDEISRDKAHRELSTEITSRESGLDLADSQNT